MLNDRAASRIDEGGAALKHYTYYRPAILVLLKEDESHGYRIASRMTDLGFDQRLVSSLYSVLRDMEHEGLITSAWEISHSGGPPRRVYALTTAGEQFLRDSLPALIRQREALGAMLELYSTLVQRQPTSTPAAPRMDRPGPGPTGDGSTGRPTSPNNQIPPARNRRGKGGPNPAKGTTAGSAIAPGTGARGRAGSPNGVLASPDSAPTPAPRDGTPGEKARDAAGAKIGEIPTRTAGSRQSPPGSKKDSTVDRRGDS